MKRDPVPPVLVEMARDALLARAIGAIIGLVLLAGMVAYALWAYP